MNVRASRQAVRLMAAGAACTLLGACVGNPFADAQVDPRSPIAAEVAKSVRADAKYPTFRGIPSEPKNLRPHRQYGQQAAQVEKEAAAVVAATADSTWTLGDTEAFAARARAAAGPELPPGPPADTAATAKDIKARATPPPPPKD